MSLRTEIPQPQSRPPDISLNLLMLGVYWVALVIIERVTGGIDHLTIFSTWLGQGLAVVFVAVLGSIIWSFRRYLYQTLTSLSFSVAILLVLLIATMFGTLIIQGAGRDQLAKIYGGSLAAVIVGLRLDDIFHSLWFGGLLLIFMAALILVAYKRRMWKLPKWGYLLSHLGVVVIIIGALIGFFTGFKGFLDIHQGEEKTSVAAVAGGQRTSESRDLGFTVRLDKFEVDKYETGYRLYVYKLGDKDFDVSKSIALDEAKDWSRLTDDFEFRVTKVYPDFYQTAELKEAPEGAGKPALELTLDGANAPAHIFAGTLADPGLALADGAAVRFLWSAPSDDDLAGLAGQTPSAHVVVFQAEGSAKAEQVTVEIGKSYQVGGGNYLITVLEYQPDFIYDTETKQPASRSLEPNNPALRVSVKDAAAGKEDSRWLFANMPDFGREHGADASGPTLIYQYHPGRAPAAREAVVVGETRELIALAAGAVTERKPLPAEGQGIAELGARSHRLLKSAVENEVSGTKSEEFNNPVVELEIREAGQSRLMLLPALHSEPLRLPDGKTVVTFEKRPDEVKAYRSQIAVLEGGTKVKEQVVAVNHPLKHKGFTFYQASFKEEDPTYSGLQVVRDPGLGVVWIGFVMICLGVIFSYYIRPQVLKRRTSHAG